MSPQHMDAFREHAAIPLTRPVNTSDHTLEEVVTVLRRRNVRPQDMSRPYWNPSVRYSGVELFAALSEFFDRNVQLLPNVLPPTEDVQRFIEEVTSRPGRTTVAAQLDIALEITNNSVVGAANLAWIATRLMARGHDCTAYPTIAIDMRAIENWNRVVSQFETDGEAGNDAAGDTYYFWTQFFAAVALGPDGLNKAVNRWAHHNGPDIMRAVRAWAVKDPLVTDHWVGATLGWEVGRACSNLVELSQANDHLTGTAI